MLAAKGVDSELSAKFISIIDDCEMEHYSPSASANNMNVIFEDSMNTITAIENSLKGAKKASGRKFMLLVLLCCFAAPAFSVTKENADDEYKKGNYQQAIKDYNEILKSGASSAVYYNLGNAYYRTDNITYAILNYERALMLSPGDDDIQVNLQLAQAKTIDKITPEPQMFLVKWARSLVNFMSIDAWAQFAIESLFLSLVMFLLYLFSKNMAARKVGFYCGVLFAALFVLSNVCAFRQKAQLDTRNTAIVVAPSVQLKSVPDAKGGNASVIHEGTKVEIIDNTLKDWKMVRLGDNREGWLKASQIEII